MNSQVEILLKVALAGAALSIPAWAPKLSPNVYAGGRSTDMAAVEQRNTSAVAQLLGEFRASMSDMMFIKTEVYLHGGVAYAPHMDMDRTAQTGELAHKGDPPKAAEPGEVHEIGAVTGMIEVLGQGAKEEQEEEDDHAGIATMIPSADEDFRAFIGDLHRQVKPWRDPSLPHIHDNGTELLPWYRMMTLSNPHHVRGYMIGAWWLKGFGTEAQKAEALAFIDEGLRNNPEAFQLWLMKGYLLRQDEKNPEAMAQFLRAAELAAKTRPSNGTESGWWTNYQEEDARAAMRLAVLSELNYGSEERARELAREYLALLGDDGVLRRQLAGEAE